MEVVIVSKRYDYDWYKLIEQQQQQQSSSMNMKEFCKFKKEKDTFYYIYERNAMISNKLFAI